MATSRNRDRGSGTGDRQSYRRLEAWQEAVNLAEDAYEVAKMLPRHEQFGLAQQLRRAALSVPSNIAEGYGRRHRKEYLHHLYMARGSLMELETCLIIADRTAAAPGEVLHRSWEQAQAAGKLLNGLVRSLEPDPHCSDPVALYGNPDPRSPIPDPGGRPAGARFRFPPEEIQRDE
jgi:four helix bundle protein